MNKVKIILERLLIIGIFGVAAFFMYQAWKDYRPFLQNDISLERLKKEVKQGEDDRPDIDWDKLKKTNPDIIAWIKVKGTKIDYPVLKAKSWNYYLHRDYTGKKNRLGSIFVQPETANDFSNNHTIIYGHNMASLSMFGSLHRFEKKSFWEKHHTVYIYQQDRTILATAYSTYDCQDKTDTYLTTFETDSDWKEWIQMTKGKSYYNTGKNPKTTDRIITLSTCSNGRNHTSRYVVNCIIDKVTIYED